MRQIFDLITPAVAWIVVAGVLIFTAVVVVRRRRRRPGVKSHPAGRRARSAQDLLPPESTTAGGIDERAKREHLAPTPPPGTPLEDTKQFAGQPAMPAAPSPVPRRGQRVSRRVQGAVIWSLVFGILTVYTMLGFLAFGIAFDFERVLFLAATVWGIGVQVYTLVAGA
jgi:hypothetical protein